MRGRIVKLTAEEVVAFLHAPVDKLALLNLLKERCDALEVAEAEYVSALDAISKSELNGYEEEYVECYADQRANREELKAYRELFVRVFENLFYEEDRLSSYERTHDAFIEVRQTLDRLNNLASLTEREEWIRRDLLEIESTIRKISKR